MTVSGATIPFMEKENYTASSLKHLAAPLILQTSIRLKTIGWSMKGNSTKTVNREEGNFS